jgi:hypothetical protein
VIERDDGVGWLYTQQKPRRCRQTRNGGCKKMEGCKNCVSQIYVGSVCNLADILGKLNQNYIFFMGKDNGCN